MRRAPRARWRGPTLTLLARVFAEPFTFSLREPSHGISFAIGEGDDGSPLLSYSVCHAFYQLPDGSKWAEHTDLYDVDDLRAASKRAKLPFRQLTEDLRCETGRVRMGRECMADASSSASVQGPRAACGHGAAAQ